MNIGNIYDKNPPTISDQSNLKDAAKQFVKLNCSDLMVIDSEGNFIGVVSEGDLIRNCMPKYNDLINDGLSLEDVFDIFVDKGASTASTSVMKVVITNPITVSKQTHLQKAASYMLTKNIRRLPVVENGKLIGSVSRAMIAQAILN